MGREGQVGGTNGCSKRASEEKQIFALDLEHIPGIQMTFPPVILPAPLITLDHPFLLKRKTYARLSEMAGATKALGMRYMKATLLKGAQYRE